MCDSAGAPASIAMLFPGSRVEPIREVTIAHRRSASADGVILRTWPSGADATYAPGLVHRVDGPVWGPAREPKRAAMSPIGATCST